MRYVSTRGAAPELGFTDVLLAGLANDGGLYVPAEWPALPPAAVGASYAQRAAQIDSTLRRRRARRRRRCNGCAPRRTRRLRIPTSRRWCSCDEGGLRARVVPRPDPGVQGHCAAVGRSHVRRSAARTWSASDGCWCHEWRYWFGGDRRREELRQRRHRRSCFRTGAPATCSASR